MSASGVAGIRAVFSAGETLCLIVRVIINLSMGLDVFLCARAPVCEYLFEDMCG